MNFKALIKSLLLRKFSTGLLLLQLALTFGLLVNTAILSNDTEQKLTKPTGLALDNLLVVEMYPTSGAFKEQSYYKSITLEDLDKIRAMPGVLSVAPSVQLPIQSGGWNGNVTDVDDPDARLKDRMLSYVTFFYSDQHLASTFGLEIVEGRYLNDADEAQANQQTPPNIVITESLKNALYGDDSALGKMTTSGTVVGVVKDMTINPRYDFNKQYAVFFNSPIYFPGIPQHYVINAHPNQLATIKAQIADVILGVQPERDIQQVFTMREHLHQHYQTDQGLVHLFSALGYLMIAITAISSFAYAQFHISQQTKFIGIRRALGATKSDILIYVLSENWLVNALGCLLGLAVAVGLNILLSQQLAISMPSVGVYLLATGTMFIASTLATWLPAKKTSSIAPVIATRTV